MSQSKFETIDFKRTPVLFFKINGDEYRQMSVDSEIGFVEFFTKNNKYCLSGGSGKYTLSDLENDKVLGEYDHLIACGEFPTNFIDASIAGFNMLNSLLGDEPLTDGEIEVYSENDDFLANVKESYFKEHNMEDL